jgi:hypothetical protein
MGEIAQLLEQKGLSTEISEEAEQAVLKLVISKVPPQFQGILESFLGNSQGTASGDGTQTAASGGGLGSLLGMAEGLLGKHNG